MDIGLRHQLNVIKTLLGREPEEIFKSMDSYSISRLAHGIIDATADEVARLFGSFVMIYNVNDIDGAATEYIDEFISEEYGAHRISSRELKELYTYLVIYRYLSKYGTEIQVNNFIMYGNIEGVEYDTWEIRNDN